MARKLTDIATAVQEQNLMNGLTGPVSTKVYKVNKGLDAITEDRSVNILLFGDWGSGKTNVIVGMLKCGLKVLVITTDFGKSGMNTVYNAFRNPDGTLTDDAQLLGNLMEVELDYQGFIQFVRDPRSIVPGIYEWDPDFIFQDGLTAYQQADLEAYITHDDPLREDTNWKDWRSAANGTLFPLMKLLALQNPHTGRKWHKCVTCLEDKKGEFEKPSTGNPKEERSMIPGSERRGPMLHTGARKVTGAGFDIILQLKATEIGGSYTYKYFSRGPELMTKDRGFQLPAQMEGDFVKLWKTYIEPKIRGVQIEKA